MKLFDVRYEPSDYSIVEKYDEIRPVYQTELSPTIITLVESRESRNVSTLLLVSTRKRPDSEAACGRNYFIAEPAQNSLARIF